MRWSAAPATRASAYRRGDLQPPPQLAVATDGPRGGRRETADGRAGSYPAAPLAGPIVDAYGAGDSFAAGLASALARGDDPEQALAVAAVCAAEALGRRGAHGFARPRALRVAQDVRVPAGPVPARLPSSCS